MTPAQLIIYADAYAENMKEAQERARQELYVSASLISTFVGLALNGKQKPSYEKIFGTEKNEMTDEQMYATVKALNARFGGTEV